MSIEKEKLLDRRTLYQGKLIQLCLDRVSLAGRKTSREVVLHSEAAAIIPVTADKKVLFVKQYRYPIGQELLEIPAGKADPGESEEDCAARELEEETGYIGTLQKLGEMYSSPGFCDEKIHLYLAQNLVHTKQHLDEGEYLDVITIPLSDVFGMIRRGEIRDAKTLSAFAIAGDLLHSL